MEAKSDNSVIAHMFTHSTFLFARIQKMASSKKLQRLTKLVASLEIGMNASNSRKEPKGNWIINIILKRLLK